MRTLQTFIFLYYVTFFTKLKGKINNLSRKSVDYKNRSIYSQNRYKLIIFAPLHPADKKYISQFYTFIIRKNCLYEFCIRIDGFVSLFIQIYS